MALACCDHAWQQLGRMARSGRRKSRPWQLVGRSTSAETSAETSETSTSETVATSTLSLSNDGHSRSTAARSRIPRLNLPSPDLALASTSHDGISSIPPCLHYLLVWRRGLLLHRDVGWSEQLEQSRPAVRAITLRGSAAAALLPYLALFHPISPSSPPLPSPVITSITPPQPACSLAHRHEAY